MRRAISIHAAPASGCSLADLRRPGVFRSRGMVAAFRIYDAFCEYLRERNRDHLCDLAELTHPFGEAYQPFLREGRSFWEILLRAQGASAQLGVTEEDEIQLTIHVRCREDSGLEYCGRLEFLFRRVTGLPVRASVKKEACPVLFGKAALAH
ncbi:MAG: hypothetical protein V1856_02250 [Candidatus Liptonbacteria bacterium]